MLKGLRWALKAKDLIQPTDEQIGSINATAYERLKALALSQWSTDWKFDESTGSVVFNGDDGLPIVFKTRFKRFYDWIALIGLIFGRELLPEMLISPSEDPSRYKRSGRRFPTPGAAFVYNVKYHGGDELVVDLGAIQA